MQSTVEGDENAGENAIRLLYLLFLFIIKGVVGLADLIWDLGLITSVVKTISHPLL
jgi:hypothetical protein